MNPLSIEMGYGKLQALAIASGIHTMGKFYIVIPNADTANWQTINEMFPSDYDGKVRVFATLEAAYAAARSNADDVIFLAGNTTHNLAAGISWSKNRIHVIGLDGGGRRVQQGAKVQLGGAIATAYVMKEIGIRNSFHNIKFIQASTNAAAISVLQFGGEGSYYKNCSAVFGVANNLGNVAASEVINGADSYTFEDCTWGADTLLTTAARQVESIAEVTANQECKSNIWINQTYIISSSSAAATFVRLATVGSVLFTNLWRNPVFQASVDSAGGIALTGGAIQTGTGTVKGTLNFYYPGFFNVGGSLAAGGDNAAVQVVAPASVASAIKGIQPTA